MEMEFTIKFDRPVTDEHYIVPGGYVINGKEFDFFDSEWSKVKDDELSFYVSGFDSETFPDTIITKEDTYYPFDEFFIYVGEAGEPRIIPVEVKSLSFFIDGEEIIYSSENIKLLNELIKEDFA